MSRLDGKVAIITGASQGMGAMHARRLAAEGARVVLTDIQQDAGKKLAEEIGGEAAFLMLDVTSEEDWSRVVADTVDRFGRIDVMVNNAGIGIFKSLEDLSVAEYEKTMTINATSVFLSMRAVLPVMKRTGGSIINISSIDGLVGEESSIAYGASKFAVTGMTKTAAMELGGYGIRVNSVHPGAVATELGDAASETLGMKDPYRTIPLQRAGEVGEISNLIVFLASDEASYITGAEMVIDGGKIAGTTW